MAKTLIKTHRDIVPYQDVLKYVNDRTSNKKETLQLAIVALGIGVVTSSFVKGLSPKISKSLQAAGLSIGASAILDAIMAYHVGPFQTAIANIRVGGYMIVTTRTYENISGSGNSYWLSTEHLVSVHHDSN